MTEEELQFGNSIDCNFPYNSPLKWRRAVAKARTLSLNAVFDVIYELCYVPRYTKVSTEQREKILLHLTKRYRHPILTKLVPIIYQLIHNDPVSVSHAIKAMQLVRKHPNQYQALNLCYMACDDKFGVADTLYNTISQEWKIVSGR